MSPTVVIVHVAIAVLLVAAVMLHSWYVRTLEARLQAEATAHLPMRRRIRRLARYGPRSATEQVQENRFGWWWIWADVHEEAMGVAWTKWGARRQLQAYVQHRVLGSRPPRHVVVPQVQRPRRRVSIGLPETVPPNPAT